MVVFSAALQNLFRLASKILRRDLGSVNPGTGDEGVGFEGEEAESCAGKGDVGGNPVEADTSSACDVDDELLENLEDCFFKSVFLRCGGS